MKARARSSGSSSSGGSTRPARSSYSSTRTYIRSTKGKLKKCSTCTHMYIHIHIFNKTGEVVVFIDEHLLQGHELIEQRKPHVYPIYIYIYIYVYIYIGITPRRYLDFDLTQLVMYISIHSAIISRCSSKETVCARMST